MIAQLAFFALIGTILIGLGHRLGRSAFLVAATAPAVSLLWVCVHLSEVASGSVLSESVSWVGDLGLALDLRLDAMAATMTLIISGIGVVVLLYARLYFDPDQRDLARIAGLLTLFAGSMVGVVQADHLLLVYTFWELTSITSYLLIGNDHTDPNARAAALHALLVTSAGGLAMLGGFVLLGQETGSFHLSELAASSITSSTPLVVALLLVLLGAFSKSAQYPFHAWLPGAMVAPTPVSAYLHSATMVKAGVYLIARFAPVFAAVAIWRPLVLAVGLVTFLFGGLRTLRQQDLKLLLAFGTVSQLGFMVVLFGAGTPAATLAGWLLLCAHALFKGALFLVVGVLDRVTGTRDIRRLPPLAGGWRWVEVVSAVSAASMAGIPLLAGFVAKESAYAAFADAPFGGSGLVLAVIVAGSMLSVAYSARFHLGAFVAPRRRGRALLQDRKSPDFNILLITASLAVPTVVLGLVPSLGEGLASASVRSLDPNAGSANLALWHGFNLPLVLSALTLAGGWVLGRANRPVQQTLATGSGIPRGEEVYLRLLRGVGRLARGVTAVVQNGSLPVYAAVILLTAVLLPASVLVGSWDWPGWPSLGPVTDVPIVAVLAIAALGAASVRRRFSAAVFLGVVGYSMAALFVTYGAPDLALTQVVVETLSTVVFVLVLRRLPDRFERQSSPRRRALRLAIAGIVGIVVFTLALVAGATRTDNSVSDDMIARSVPDGHGRNVVNVILVDFRALDTLGESTVLAAASIGAVALARVGRRAAEERAGGRHMLASSAETGLRRIVFVDVPAWAIFHLVLMASLWLLFAGHNQPGGGFVGGLLAGAAITLRYVAGGIAEVRGRSRFRPWTVLGVGLLLAGITALLPLLTGGEILDVDVATITMPLLGDLSLSSALLFDGGIYLAVVGIVLMAFEAFGEDPVRAAT